MQVDNESEMSIGKEIINQTDRASAIIATAYLEDKLLLTLKTFLTKDPRTNKVFERMTEPSGQLGAFGTKIDIAYLLGIFGHLTHKDLKQISKIRNRFAHLSQVLDFGDQVICNLCETLTVRDTFWRQHPAHKEFERPFTKEVARRAFIESISFFSNQFLAIGRSDEYLQMAPLG
jgi:DNA-binding MltR family transcriptional regulator